LSKHIIPLVNRAQHRKAKRETELQAARNALTDAQADGLTGTALKPFRDAVKAARTARDNQQ
jgi:hypothetical protein